MAGRGNARQASRSRDSTTRRCTTEAFSIEALRKQASDYRPTLNALGAMERDLLDRFDGTHSAAELESWLTERRDRSCPRLGRRRRFSSKRSSAAVSLGPRPAAGPATPRSSVSRCGRSTPTCQCSASRPSTSSWRVSSGRYACSARCSRCSHRDGADPGDLRSLCCHCLCGLATHWRKSVCEWRLEPMPAACGGRSLAPRFANSPSDLRWGWPERQPSRRSSRRSWSAPAGEVLRSRFRRRGRAGRCRCGGQAVPARRAMRLDPVTALQTE